MAKLDNLMAKILADNEAKAKEILSEAERQARGIIDEAAAAAEKEAAQILAQADAEAARRQEQMLLSQTLSVRDENLAAKGKALDDVFAEAGTRLAAMQKEELLAFLQKRLPELDTDGQELILPKRYGITDISALNEALRAAGKKGDLALYTGERDIPSGFILQRDGIEQNNTFEALVEFCRYELEGEVLKALY